MTLFHFFVSCSSLVSSRPRRLQFVDRALELDATRKAVNEAHELDALEYAKREAEEEAARRLAREEGCVEGEVWREKCPRSGRFCRLVSKPRTARDGAESSCFLVL